MDAVCSVQIRAGPADRCDISNAKDICELVDRMAETLCFGLMMVYIVINCWLGANGLDVYHTTFAVH